MRALRKPSLKKPKELLAYLKAGCEIKQVGSKCSEPWKRQPEYFLIDPDRIWEVPVEAKFVDALESLDLIEVDFSVRNEWFSKANFALPEILDVNNVN